MSRRWPKDRPTDREIDRAGRVLRDDHADPKDVLQALDVVRRWRSTHSFPLNTLQMSLRNAGHEVSPEAMIAQRLKRMESIEAKLKRLLSHSLHEMQDIAGCRCVVPTVSDVESVVARLKNSRMRHSLHRSYNYIERPKRDGYRSHHLVYEYYSDRSTDYKGMRIEVQVRSGLQHAWATAIETIGTFRGELLKAGLGDPRWLRFFQLVASAFALMEGCPTIPDTPNDPDLLVSEIESLAGELRVGEILASYTQTMNIYGDVIGEEQILFLIESIPDLDGRPMVDVRVDQFRSSDRLIANARYAAAESRLTDHPGASVVLVSTDSLKALQAMYPNYYADTSLFLKNLREIIDRGGRGLST